jgi:ASC-1-like (ASCH) protein
MLEKENYSLLLPGVSSYAEAFNIYSNIYDSAKVNQNGGMLVFELE